MLKQFSFLNEKYLFMFECSYRGLLNTTLCDKFVSDGGWFSTGTLVSSTNKNDRHDITEILLKVC